MSEVVIAFNKVKEPYGWLSNMSPYSIVYGGETYRTAEHLFQALRFDEETVIAEIVKQTSPMAAKMVAHKNKHLWVIEPRGDYDLANMEVVLRLKIAQNPGLKNELLKTKGLTLIEDTSKRNDTFWGAKLLSDGTWDGENHLGKLWMKVRDSLQE